MRVRRDNPYTGLHGSDSRRHAEGKRLPHVPAIARAREEELPVARLHSRTARRNTGLQAESEAWHEIRTGGRMACEDRDRL